MPSQIVNIPCTDRINRRAILSEVPNGQVISRTNFYVTGQKPYLKVKKFPGSDRYNATSVGNYPAVWAHRYYTKLDVRKNFFFSSGVLYFIDEHGNTTALTPTVFSPTAYPCSVQARASSTDKLFFSEGETTGMYSHDGNIGNVFQKEDAVTLNFSGMAVHLDRIFGFEEDSEDLYYSVNLDFTNFTDSTDAGVITIGAKRSSKIQQIIVYQETLFIFKNDSIWVLEGRTPSEFQVREVHPTLGLAARRSLVAGGSVLFGLMSDYEVYSFGGTQASTKLLTYDIGLSGGLVNTNENLLPLISMTKMSEVCAGFHNFMYRMSFTAPGDTYNRYEYIFNTINEIDAFTFGNNVGTYLVYDRVPDQKQLVTGRSDVGRLMHQYRGLNWDNQESGSGMRLLHQTGFYGTGEPRNIRVRRVWGNFGVLGARPLPVRMLTDSRTALSDSTSEDFDTQGETKSVAGLSIQSQSAVTSRTIPKHNNAKCQNFSLLIDETLSNMDTEFSGFHAEIITPRNSKRNKRVGV